MVAIVQSAIMTNARLMFAEITAFSDRYEEFEKLNTEILGVSIDSVVCENAIVIVFHYMIVSLIGWCPKFAIPKSGQAKTWACHTKIWAKILE